MKKKDRHGSIFHKEDRKKHKHYEMILGREHAKKKRVSADEMVVVPWTGQEGEGPFNVIFDSKIFYNRWYASSTDCPRNGSTTANPNWDSPWEQLRDATSEEIAKGNPTICDINPDGPIPPTPPPAPPTPDPEGCTTLLCPDIKTTAMYSAVGYKPDGSGTNLSYTATRAVKSVYNLYQSTKVKPLLSAYITDWCQYDGRLIEDPTPANAGRGFDLSKIDPKAYDRLVFSFMGICGDFGEKAPVIQRSVDGWNNQKPGNPMGKGHIVLMDPWGDLATYVNVGLANGQMELTYDNYLKYYNQDQAAGLLGGLRELKNKNPNLQLSFSVGGWTLSGFFSDMVKNNSMRNEFIISAIDLFTRFPMFDGIDIDWEYPGSDGNTGNHFDPENDGKNYAILIKELRIALDQAFPDPKKFITVAISSDVDKLALSNIPGLYEAGIDACFLMSYDFFGTGWAEQLGHHTNLNASQVSKYSANKAIEWLQAHGIPLSIIHLGYANYARSGAGADLSTLQYNISGNALGTFENGSYEFYDLIKNAFDLENGVARGKNGFTLMTDTDADADILYNKTTKNYISLDTPRTVKNKALYAVVKGLAGVFSWSGDEDDGLLANAAREGMNNTLMTEKFSMTGLYNKGEEFDMSNNGHNKVGKQRKIWRYKVWYYNIKKNRLWKKNK